VKKTGYARKCEEEQKKKKLRERKRKNQQACRKRKSQEKKELEKVAKMEGMRRLREQRWDEPAKTPKKIKDRVRKRAQRLKGKVEEMLPTTPETKKRVTCQLTKLLNKDSEESARRVPVDEMTTNQKTKLFQALLQIQRHKIKGQYHQMQETIETVLVNQHLTVAEIARVFEIEAGPLYTLMKHHQNKPSKKPNAVNRKLTAVEVKAIQETYEKSDVTMEVPHKKHRGKRFLRETMRMSYKKYVTDMEKLETYGGRIVSFSSFNKNRPKSVRLQKKIPDMGCQCDVCLNCALKAHCLVAFGVKGISKVLSANVFNTLCRNTDKDDEEMTLADCRLECINRDCKQCSVIKFKHLVKELNKGIDWTTSASFSEWTLVPVEESERQKRIREALNEKKTAKKSFEQLRRHTTLEGVLDCLTKDLETMARHMFNFKFQGNEFEQSKANLQPGDVLFVCDFSTNYTCVHWVEPQSTFWSRKQATMHTAVAYFRCPQPDCKHLCKDEILVVSDDLVHDCFAVEAFTDKMIEHLEQTNVPVQRVIRFSDNCATQYKSRHVFALVSQRKIPFLLNNTGAKHGKGEADGFGGRTKQKITAGLSNGTADIEDAESLVEYLSECAGTVDEHGLRRKKKRIIHADDKAFIVDFYKKEDIVQVDAGGTKRLIMSLRETYERYRTNRKENGCMAVSMATFIRLKPATISTATPDLAKEMEPRRKRQPQDEDELEAQSCCPTSPVECERAPEPDDELGSEITPRIAAPGPGFCQHSRRHYFCVNDIKRDTTRTPAQHAVPQTRAIHSVRNVGIPGILEVRYNSCSCDFCMNGTQGPCPNKDFVLPFRRYKLYGLPQTKCCDVSNKLWTERPVDRTKVWRPPPRKKPNTPRPVTRRTDKLPAKKVAHNVAEKDTASSQTTNIQAIRKKKSATSDSCDVPMVKRRRPQMTAERRGSVSLESAEPGNQDAEEASMREIRPLNVMLEHAEHQEEIQEEKEEEEEEEEAWVPAPESQPGHSLERPQTTHESQTTPSLKQQEEVTAAPEPESKPEPEYEQKAEPGPSTQRTRAKPVDRLMNEEMRPATPECAKDLKGLPLNLIYVSKRKEEPIIKYLLERERINFDDGKIKILIEKREKTLAQIEISQKTTLGQFRALLYKAMLVSDTTNLRGPQGSLGDDPSALLCDLGIGDLERISIVTKIPEVVQVEGEARVLTNEPQPTQEPTTLQEESGTTAPDMMEPDLRAASKPEPQSRMEESQEKSERQRQRRKRWKKGHFAEYWSALHSDDEYGDRCGDVTVEASHRQLRSGTGRRKLKASYKEHSSTDSDAHCTKDDDDHRRSSQTKRPKKYKITVGN
jgi:hypothetical protein